ncbi:MAG: hypothetical protein L0Y58_03665, partial [Verrucomicrobia subdivision 3 bacterium]|nr:hypothetical protein [Limisphaerales bacterium]
GGQMPTRYANNYTSFAWSDGTPTETERGSPTGIFVTGFTNGFRLTAPADTRARLLRVYVGLYGAAGTFRAWLSDGSAPAYSDASLDDIYANRYAVYLIDYAAAAQGQKLIVQYRASRLYDMDYGNVTLQAATLQGDRVGPPLELLNARKEGDALVFQFRTETGKTYTVQRATQLPGALWETVAILFGDGNVAIVSDPMGPAGQAFYRIREP